MSTSATGPTQGFSVYRAPEPTNIDCHAMRRIDHHARHLARILGSLALRSDTCSHNLDLADEWQRIEQWLSMAAGLRFVNVERIEPNPWQLCSTADAYESAHNNLASDHATEHTRLLYAWSALERLLKIVELAPVPDKRANNAYNRAGLLLSTRVPDERLPAHFSCVRKHLQAHLTDDPSYAHLRGIRQAQEERPWRKSSAAVLLALGSTLRNVPAHGDGHVPEPADWSEADAQAFKLDPVLHAPRLATRGLLLSLQLLLALTTEARFRDLNAPELGWWILGGEGEWSRTHSAAARDLLWNAHLSPPEDDDARQDEDDDFDQ